MKLLKNKTKQKNIHTPSTLAYGRSCLPGKDKKLRQDKKLSQLSRKSCTSEKKEPTTLAGKQIDINIFNS